MRTMCALLAAAAVLGIADARAPAATAPPKASCNLAIVDARESFALVRISIATSVVKIIESLDPASLGQPLTVAEVAGLKTGLKLLNQLVAELNTDGSIVTRFNRDSNACANWAGP